jgi:hypothetical protein
MGFFRRNKNKNKKQSQSQQKSQQQAVKALASLKSNPSDEGPSNHPSDEFYIDGGSIERMEGSEKHAADGDEILVATAPPPSRAAATPTTTPRKFKAPHVPVGNKIAQRAAELKQGYKDDQPDTPATPLAEVAAAPAVLTPPPTRSVALAKKQYWQERAFHHDADVDASSEDMAAEDVKQRLPTAFTPTGGDSMPGVLGEEEEQQQQGTTTTPETPTKEPPIKHQVALLQKFLEEQTNVPTVDCQEDPHYATYETWYQKGLLTWRPAVRKDATGAYHHSNSMVGTIGTDTAGV